MLFWFKNIQLSNIIKKLFNFRIIQLLLLVFIFLSFFYGFGSVSFFIKTPVDKAGAYSAQEMKLKDLQTPVIKEDYKDFLQTIDQKGIFTPVYEEEAVASSFDREKINQLIGGLRLAGILTRNPPKAIVEDEAKQQTYYVKEGDVIVEGVILKKIRNNSIEIKCYGEKVELYL